MNPVSLSEFLLSRFPELSVLADTVFPVPAESAEGGMMAAVRTGRAAPPAVPGDGMQHNGCRAQLCEPAPHETRNTKPETALCAPPRRRRRWKRLARRGRPTLLTEDIADAMYESILKGGVSDSRAGLLAHVSRATVCRWKKQDPEFADFLELARAKFELRRIKKICDAKGLTPQAEARNARWLLERSRTR